MQSAGVLFLPLCCTYPPSKKRLMATGSHSSDRTWTTPPFLSFLPIIFMCSGGQKWEMEAGRLAIADFATEMCCQRRATAGEEASGPLITACPTPSLPPISVRLSRKKPLIAKRRGRGRYWARGGGGAGDRKGEYRSTQQFFAISICNKGGGKTLHFLSSKSFTCSLY